MKQICAVLAVLAMLVTADAAARDVVEIKASPGAGTRVAQESQHSQARTFEQFALFPADGSLVRPEDGVILGDGTMLVADARGGHRVVAGMRNPAQAPEFARIAVRETLQVSIETMDVDDDSSVSRAIERTARDIGSIDVLVNNAGVERVGAIEDASMDDFRAVMETNYFGAVRCIKAVVPSMRERRGGCIVNVSSISGRLSSTPMGPCAASKFALEALSESLAQELKPYDVRVLIVEPGIIDTSMAPRISTDADGSKYPSRNRMAALFNAAVEADFGVDARPK